MPLDDLYNKINALQEFDIEDEAMNVIGENSEIIKYLLQEQLSKGRDGNNKPILLLRKGKPYDFYAELTLKIKREVGAETDFITNYMTGSFYENIFTVINNGTFEQKSQVPYFEQIIKQNASHEDIMKLSPENLEYFSKNILFPGLEKKLAERLNT